MTLLTTYQSCKELIANNLQEKGVQASADEGLTTLANKILNIDNDQVGQYANIIFTCNIDLPKTFPYNNDLKDLEFVLFGSHFISKIKYSDLNEGQYIFHHVPVGRCVLYCSNVTTLFADKQDIFLAFNSIFIKETNLTNNQTFHINLHIEYGMI